MKAMSSFLFAVLVLVLAAGRVMAEETQGDRFRFSVNTRADYTDNRDSAEVGEEENWDFFIRPRADVLFESELLLLDFYYAPAFRYRTEPSDEQDDTEIQHDLGLNAKHRVSRRLILRLNEKFDLTDDRIVSMDGSSVPEDRSYMMNSVGGGIDFIPTRRTEIDLRVRNRIMRYDEDVVASRSDEDRTEVGIKVIQQFNRNLRANIEGSYSIFGYESPRTITRDFDSILAAVGVEQVLSKNLTVGAQAGVQMQTYDDATIDDASNPFARLSVRGSTVPSFRLTGAVTHGVRDADVYPFASQEYSEVRGTVDWDSTPSITLSLSGMYRLSDYDDVLPSATALVDLLGLPAGDETTIDLYGQAAYKITDSCTVLIRQRFEDVDSDVSASFSKNTTSLELTKYF